MFNLILKRPITIIMIFIALIVLGIASFTKLPFEQSPNTEFPTLSIKSFWMNTSPEIMESDVTSILESEISSLPNIHKIKSTSQVGASSITIEYNRETDMNFAYLDLSENIQIAKKNLPEQVRNKVYISKYKPRELEDNEQLINYEIFGNSSIDEIFLYTEDEILPHINSISGVGEVKLSGATSKNIEVLIDRKKMEMFNLSPSYIVKIISRDINKKQIGNITSLGKSYSIEINSLLKSVNEILDVYIFTHNQRPIYIRDIATIKETNKEDNSIYRINGKSTLIMSIIKEAGSNSIRTADLVKEKIEQLKQNMPNNITVKISTDHTKKMREQLTDIKNRGLISITVITIILLMFLKDLKTPVIIITTIFLSVLITITVIYFLNMTMNIITISGLALGMGMLVDNSIVVIENIYHYHKRGFSNLESSLKGTKEVFLPILASTLTTIVVFLPFIYLTGEKRLMWMPLVVSVCFSLASSLLVSFTLIPTLTNLTMRKQKIKKKILTEHFEINTNFYHTILKLLIHNKVLTISFVVFIFCASFFFFGKYVDKGEIFQWQNEKAVTLSLSMPMGASIEMADSIIKSFESKITEVGGYDKFTTALYSSSYGVRAYVKVLYTDDNFHSEQPFIMTHNLIAKAHNFAGPAISIYNPLNVSGAYRSGGSTGQSFTNSFIIKGYNYYRLKQISQKIKEELLKTNKVTDVDINSTGWYSPDLFAYTLAIDREKLATFNVSVIYLYRFILANIGGGNQSNFITINDNERNYTVKISDYKDYSVSELNNLIYPYSDRSFRIKDVASIVKEPVLRSIDKEDQAYKRSIKFNFRGSNKASNIFQTNFTKNYPLPSGYEFDREEYNYMTEKDIKEIILVILMAVLLVYMVTSSLFESFIHPFIVIMTIPLGLIGVFLIFFLMDVSFNRDAYMGTILLAGIAVNNSIVLINHINHLRSEGMDILKAIIIGSNQRIRPILMTTFTTVIGILPLIINSDAKEDFWYTLSLTTIGGLTSSTIFVLFVIPVLYATMERLKTRLSMLVINLKQIETKIP